MCTPETTPVKASPQMNINLKHCGPTPPKRRESLSARKHAIYKSPRAEMVSMSPRAPTPSKLQHTPQHEEYDLESSGSDLSENSDMYLDCHHQIMGAQGDDCLSSRTLTPRCEYEQNVSHISATFSFLEKQDKDITNKINDLQQHVQEYQNERTALEKEKISRIRQIENEYEQNKNRINKEIDSMKEVMKQLQMEQYQLNQGFSYFKNIKTGATEPSMTEISEMTSDEDEQEPKEQHNQKKHKHRRFRSMSALSAFIRRKSSL